MAHASLEPATLDLEPDAVAQARQRLETQRSVLGDRHPDYAVGLNQLALLLIMHGDPDEAEPLLREALAVRKEALGEDHPDYATNLSSLAGLLWARGDLGAAEPLLRQALEIRWLVLGADHPKTVAILSSLEQLLQMKHDLAGHERLPEDTPDADPSGSVLLDETGPGPGCGVEEPAANPSETARHEPEGEIATSNVATAVQRTNGDPRSRRMSITSHDLTHELAVLSDVFASLGGRLGEAARQLHAPGIPLPEPLIAELSTCRRDFDSLRDRARTLAGSLHVECPPDEALASLQDLSALLDGIDEAEVRQSRSEEVRRRALSVLDRVLLLSHVIDAGFSPLRGCQDQARALHGAIAEGPWTNLPADAEPLSRGEHAFAHLLTLIEERDELDDDLWATLHESVATAFGKPMAAAAARAKLALPLEHASSAVAG